MRPRLSARRIDQQQIKTAFLGRIPTKLRDPQPIEAVISLADLALLTNRGIAYAGLYNSEKARTCLMISV